MRSVINRGDSLAMTSRLNAATRLNRKQMRRKATSVPSNDCKQKPLAAKSSFSSLRRFSQSARAL